MTLLHSNGKNRTVHKSSAMKLLLLTLCLCSALPASSSYGHPGAHAKLAYLNQQIEEQPDDQSLYIQRGAVYSNNGQFEPALADFRRAETLGKPLAVAFEMGVLRYRQGKFAQARAYFDRCLKNSPKHTTALEYRARLLRDAGDHKASLADYRALFALQNSSAPGNYIAASKLLAQQGEAGLIAAINILDEGMQQLGLIPPLQRHAIKLELRRQQTVNAIQRLASLEPMLGKSPDWKTDMGELHLLDGNTAQARELFNAAATQLAALRKTPARLALLEKIRKLQEKSEKKAHCQN